MTNIIVIPLSLLKRSFSITLLILVAIASASAQSSRSATDGTTPQALAPGTPAGSYALSGFDNINPYNGSLNFHLPLLQVGGRGAAGYTMMLPIEQHWRVNHNDEFGIHTPNPNWWSGLRPGYGPGVLQGRQIHEGCGNGGPAPEGQFQTGSMTRLTFTAPDGTEYELVDQLTGGQPGISTCCCYYNQTGNGASRGKVFVTKDGSAATFISDSTIYDWSGNIESGPHLIYPSGYFILRDGTRYRVADGLVSWIRDRNGNKVTFTYEMVNYRVTSITDSIGRQINISYQSGYDEISYKGFGGTVWRTIRINYASLSNALRSGFTPLTYAQLFPNLNGASSSTVFGSLVVSSVTLPNSSNYQFAYNPHGELARVVLPTGGAFEYEWETVPLTNEIYRRVTERRVYPTGGTGTAFASKMTYSIPASSVTPTDPSTVIIEQYNSSGTRLTSQRHYYHGHAGAALQGWSASPLGYTWWKEGKEYQSEEYDTNSTTLLRQVTNTWYQDGNGAANNPRIIDTTTRLMDISPNLIAKQTFSYDQYNNQTDVYEYDYGVGAVGSFVRRTHTDYLTTNSVNSVAYDTVNPNTTSPDVNATIHLRSLPAQQWVSSNTAGTNKVSLTVYAYDQFSLDNCQSITGHDTAFTTGYGTRGNVTSITRYTNAAAATGPITTTATYDIAGNVINATDGRTKTTTVSYTDSFSDGLNHYTYAFPTSTTSPVPDPSGGYSTNTALSTSTVYDFSTGSVTSATDANGKTTSLSYNDLLDRLTTVTRPTGGGSTNYFYTDTVGNLNVRTLTSLDATRSIDAYQFFDKLGRPSRSFLHEGGSPAIFITSDTQYDSLGRVWKTSNPYRTNGSNDAVNPSGNWTTNTYDVLGRVKTITSPDGAQIMTTYSGNQMTVQDQAGKSRSSAIDALGRLKQVIENPGGLAYQTTYSYDVLGNLHTVAQDTQRRYFMYDSLSRMTRMKNPEQAANPNLALSDPLSGNSQWSTAYTYDANSNLATKTDARGVEAAYTYDNINRNITVNYSDGTHIDRIYDSATNGRGRPRGSFYYVSTGAHSHTAIDSYDAMGRPLYQRQHFFANSSWGTPYITQRTYDYAGHVASQTYPSGRTVNYAYDVAGRTNSFTGNLGDGVTRDYATSISYDEWNGLSRERYGTDTPLYHKEHRNVRGQIYDMRLSTVNDDLNWNRGAIVNYYSFQPYGFGTSGPDNNGNLLVQQHWVPTDDAISGANFMQQNYDYDALNRLAWVGEYQNGATGTGSQNYAYDRYGNRTISSASGTGINGQQFAVDPNTNRLGVPSGQYGVMQYDAAGNLYNDTYSGSGSRTYDVENRIVTATNYSNQQSTYSYDAEGKRVRRKSYGQETWQVYGLEGELLAEYGANVSPSTPQNEYGYRNGQLLVIAEGGTNAVTDFSATQNNGAWKYGSKTVSGTTFNAFPSNANLFGGGLDSWSPGYCCPMITRNATGTTYTYPGAPSVVQPSDVLNLHPGPSGEKSVVRWTASAAGTYTIAGRFQGIDTAGTTSDVTILHNATSIFSSNVSGYGNQATFSVTRTVAAGDTIDFQVGYGSNNTYYSDSTGLAATITPQSGANLQWLVADQIGTPRMIADRTGSLAGIRRHDYLPFGEEVSAGVGGRAIGQGYVGDGVRQKFTQKERDAETGLHYFGARYYSSVQGRFISADPSSVSIASASPQSWNRYFYANNNPLSYIDHNGKWPTDTHNLIIDRVFKGLSRAQRSSIKSGSYSVDDPFKGGQSTSRSNEHGMTIPGQSQDKAAAGASAFIDANLVAAQKTYEQGLDLGFMKFRPGLNAIALSFFGRAWHTVSDMTSPMHEGYQVWNSGVFNTINHVFGEHMISHYRMGLAVGATLNLFAFTFGQQELRTATNGITFGSENDPSIKEIRDHYSMSPVLKGETEADLVREEEEAVYQYRIGLQRGLAFDWANQHGNRR